MPSSSNSSHRSSGHWHRVATTLTAMVLFCAGCSAVSRDNVPSSESAMAALPDSARVRLTAAGATLPYPLYAAWFNAYAQVAPVRVNYFSVGSAGGLQALLADTVDFGATDVPVTDSVLQRVGDSLVHVPMAVAAVAVTYNVPGLTRPLQLTADVLAGMFVGRISRWNDPLLRALNPSETLPDLPITVIRRSDGTGTSYILRGFLEAASPLWRATSPAAREPAGQLLRDGSEAVASEVKATPGTVGYLEVVYARQNRLPAAHMQNTAGQFVSPMPYEIASAAVNTLEALAPLDDEQKTGFRVSLLNAPGRQSYPISSFTWWVLRPSRMSDTTRLEVARLLRWVFEDATALTSQLGYVPLPSAVANRVLEQTEAALGCAPCAQRRFPGTVP